ncbi:MAG: UDP-N-acetylmuramate--L-alanine ligase, partial [Phycisphaerales bacterium]|nr:UDP-N-acetylmuramate--L-alanine ligase [Phycisphaerales bacterium]
QMLLTFGAKVSGTDKVRSAVTDKLAELGAQVTYDQTVTCLPTGTEMVVYSAAVPREHPEMIAARELGCNILKYAEMLGRVMQLKHGIAIAGTHGKSTTTAMTAHVLLAAGKDPSFVVGATCSQLGGSSRSGKGDFFVVEACEFDRSFHQLRPRIGVALNIEEDHLDYYKDIQEIDESFAKFLNQVEPAGGAGGGGVVLISATDEHCAIAAKNCEASVETYGIDVPADWQATGIRRFQNKTHFQVNYKSKKMGRLTLSIAGRHNVGNATVAAAIATHCGVPWEKIQTAIESFAGADRRSQLLLQIPLRSSDPAWRGEVRTATPEESVTIVDDYGHHPTEIRATLEALREHYRPQRLICIFQPHQHSRTRFLLDDFAKSFSHADVTIVPDIYFVRDSEADRMAVNSAMLVEKINGNASSDPALRGGGSGGSGRSGPMAVYIPTFKQIVEYLMANMRPGDLIVSMGAGPVWEVTDELVRRIRTAGTA